VSKLPGVITGANRGIGLEAARELAHPSRPLVLLCRTLERARKAAAGIDGDMQGAAANLALPGEIDEVAAELANRHSALGFLVNNAGVSTLDFTRTAEGFERTLAVNHLGTVRLTLALLPLLLAGAPSRIVVVASRAHAPRWSPEVFESERTFDGRKAYRQTKLCNLLFAFDLARRLRGTGVSVTSVHPGLIATGLLDDLVGRGWFMAPVRALVRLRARGPEAGGRALAHATTVPVATDGDAPYLSGLRETTPRAAALDPSLQDELRRWTADRIGVDWGAGIEAAIEASSP